MHLNVDSSLTIRDVFRAAHTLITTGRPLPVTGEALYLLLEAAGARQGPGMMRAAKAFRLAVFGSAEPRSVEPWLGTATREALLAALDRASCEVV